MKKTVTTIAIVALIFISGFASGIKFLSNHIYSRNGIVIETNYDTDEVIWSDGYYEWSIEGIDDWMVGDGITVINFDNFTSTITDDVTIEYKYTDM